MKDGVMSFIAVETPDFDQHWQSHGVKPIPESKKSAAREFLRPVCERLSRHADQHEGEEFALLDVGCGDGVHVEALEASSARSSDAVFVGLDVSMDAIRAARGRAGDAWEFVQADAMRLPFSDGTFDTAFSFGALAYTDDPAAAFSEMCRVTKSDGQVGLWIAPPHRGVSGMLFRFTRFICRVGGRHVARLLADAIVPFLALIPTRSGMHLGNATWSQCREVVLVNIAPSRLAFPEAEAVAQWFAVNGLTIVEEDRARPVTLWGRKSGADPAHE